MNKDDAHIQNNSTISTVNTDSSFIKYLSLNVNNLNRIYSMNNKDHKKQPFIVNHLVKQPSNQDVPQSSQQFSVQLLQDDNRKQTQRKGRSPSSKHNFQKHTVVTIKKLAKRLPYQLGTSPPDVVALQMWNIFLSSGIKSKKILVILFGRANLHEQKYKELLKGFYFGEICSYSQEIVRAAQNTLRLKALEYLREEVVRTTVQTNRHISLKEEFIAYFSEFIDMLRQGPLIKFRISSTTSKHIDERIQTAETIQEERKKTMKQLDASLN